MLETIAYNMIVKMIVKMRKIVDLNKFMLIDTVIKLTNDLIKKTEFQGKVATAKRLRKLDAAWYHGFLHCQSSLLTTSGKVIKDVKHELSDKRKL